MWVHLFMGAQNLPDVVSRNTVTELVGHDRPDEVVVVSGHLDSWDVGVGAMDDGGKNHHSNSGCWDKFCCSISQMHIPACINICSALKTFICI